MNELEQALQELLLKAIKIAEQTGEFVLNQAPDLLRQFYLWHTTKYILGIILAGLIFFIATRFIRILSKKEGDPEYDIKILGRWYCDDSAAGAIVILIISGIASFILFCCSFYHLLYVLVAPKIYLINHLIC